MATSEIFVQIAISNISPLHALTRCAAVVARIAPTHELENIDRVYHVR